MTTKQKIGAAFAWAGAVCGLLFLLWLGFADEQQLLWLCTLVIGAVSLLLDTMNDALSAALLRFAPAFTALCAAAWMAGLAWLALRLHGKRRLRAALLSLIPIAAALLVLVCRVQQTEQQLLLCGGALLGAGGCLACIALYGWLKAVCPSVFNGETVRYVVFGVLTTVVSFVSHMIFVHFGWPVVACTVASWVCAVIFAYAVNKLFVFQSHTDTAKRFFRELGLFVAARLFSLGIEVVFMWVAVDLLHFANAPCKLAVQIVILVLNYLFSKWIIFRKNAKHGETA